MRNVAITEFLSLKSLWTLSVKVNVWHQLSQMNNGSEKFWSFLFQSRRLKTLRNERKLMVKQFAGEEVIFLCQYLPNNKSITIMILHSNFFINKYMVVGVYLVKSHTGDIVSLVAPARSDWQRAGDCRQWERSRWDPAPPSLVLVADSCLVAGAAAPDITQRPVLLSCYYRNGWLRIITIYKQTIL